jgi:DNA-binding CsgD family transcriptional regulator
MRSAATARKLHPLNEGRQKMGLAQERHVGPTVEELSLSRTAQGLAAELVEQVRGSNTGTIRARPRLALGGQAAAPDVHADPRVSFVVVRDGVAESFALGASARDAFSSEIATLLGGTNLGSTCGERQRVHDALSDAERRVLRYLPTNLTAREIADELFVSVNTVKTHMRHIYAKFDAHRRREAVERARALGLLPRSKHRVQDQNPRPISRAGVCSGASHNASPVGGMR